MELKCQRCSHEWDYTGESDYFATCPNCKTSVSVSEYHRAGIGTGVLGGDVANSNHGSFRVDAVDLNTEATYELVQYDDDVWVKVSISVEGEESGPYIDTLFLDRGQGVEFAKGLLEAMREIDMSDGDDGI